MVSLQIWLAHFWLHENIEMTKIQNLKQRHYLPHYWSNKGFMNRALSFTGRVNRNNFNSPLKRILHLVFRWWQYVRSGLWGIMQCIRMSSNPKIRFNYEVWTMEVFLTPLFSSSLYGEEKKWHQYIFLILQCLKKNNCTV